MPQVGTYNAATFIQGNYATYPQLPVGSTYYEPTMWWLVTGAGTIQAQVVAVGDLLFATQGSGRLFGDSLFGDGVYGETSDGGWTVQQVRFLKWDSTQAAPDEIPYPNAGYPFTRPDLPGGHWAPGWRIVIDAYYTNTIGSRTYGGLTYGSDVYGDAANAGGDRWVDITAPGYHIETGDGTQAGIQRIPVAEVVISLVDPTAAWFDVAEPSTWHQPQPGTPLRVGFIDPTFVYRPVFTGQIERIEDIHDGDHPRVVVVRGFGRVMDLTVDIAGMQRPAESAVSRFQALTALAGWYWDSGAIVFPSSGDSTLIADTQPRDITIRDEIDRTIQSVGWMFDTDRKGRMRVRTWPHEPTGTPLVVADCLATVAGHPLDPGTVVAHSIVYTNDESQLLNHVVTSNGAQPALTVTVEETPSVSRFGKRGRALDYPKGGLAWSSTTDATVWARRVLNRFSYIARHIESFEVDTLLDSDWLATLADLDTGRAVTVERRGLDPWFAMDGVITGWRHRIDPGRWTATVFLTTSTTSM